MGPLTFTVKIVSFDNVPANTICFKFNKISKRSSLTPGIRENSCSNPPIFIAVIAIPDKSDKRVRRKAFPMVRPCPFVRGKIENFP